MTREQLQSARDEQVKRYPWLDLFVSIGPVLFIIVGVAGSLAGLAITISGAKAGVASHTIAGVSLVCAAVVLTLSALAVIELMRLFMDIEIHVRRFVDGD